ncbi:MAG TPA: glycosyltransferase, partial [Candidatus Binataceae bacterium]|nr:glycosyltransferase [Candidatus Binataceae bacterium]
MTIAHIVRVVTGACVAASLFYYVCATLTALRFARRAREPAPPLPKIAPRVAFLKPLSGWSERLIRNLVSHLEIAYPRVEYIFGVTSYDDRAIEVPVGLRAPYQFAQIAVSVGEEPDCSNHKVAKLIRMAQRASDKTSIFVLSDADVSVEPDLLRRLVGELAADEKLGVVTCVYRGIAEESIAARMESLFINTDFVPQIILSEAVEPMRHALGATIAVRREALEAIGGFAALRNLLADDFYLGRKVADKGWKVALSSSIVTVMCEEQTFSDFWTHQLRWARTYRTVRPESIAAIIIHGFFWAILYTIASAFSLPAMIVLAATVAVRVAMSSVITSKVLRLPARMRDWWLVLFKDLVMTGIWFASIAGNTVVWGGKRFRLLPHGE